MLETLTVSGLNQSHPQTYHRIFFAQDAQALWYTRSDLMTVLASERGEAFAQEKISAISSLFEGLLPQSLKYREPPKLF